MTCKCLNQKNAVIDFITTGYLTEGLQLTLDNKYANFKLIWLKETNMLTPEQVKQFRQPTYEIEPTIINRWSPRSFSGDSIPEKKLLSVFEAARWAPSANNLQPWRFILARTNEDLEKFYSFINPGNLEWCKKAPVLTLLLSKITRDDGSKNGMHSFDSGTAWGFLALEAKNKGLATHAIGGFDRMKAREVLAIPEDYEPEIVIAIGYQGEKEALPEHLKQREQPNSRKSLDEIIIEGSF